MRLWQKNTFPLDRVEVSVGSPVMAIGGVMLTRLAVVSGPREANDGGGLCLVSSVAADIGVAGNYYQFY